MKSMPPLNGHFAICRLLCVGILVLTALAENALGESRTRRYVQLHDMSGVQQGLYLDEPYDIPGNWGPLQPIRRGKPKPGGGGDDEDGCGGGGDPEIVIAEEETVIGDDGKVTIGHKEISADSIIGITGDSGCFDPYVAEGMLMVNVIGGASCVNPSIEIEICHAYGGVPLECTDSTSLLVSGVGDFTFPCVGVGPTNLPEGCPSGGGGGFWPDDDEFGFGGGGGWWPDEDEFGFGSGGGGARPGDDGGAGPGGSGSGGCAVVIDGHIEILPPGVPCWDDNEWAPKAWMYQRLQDVPVSTMIFDVIPFAYVPGGPPTIATNRRNFASGTGVTVVDDGSDYYHLELTVKKRSDQYKYVFRTNSKQFPSLPSIDQFGSDKYDIDTDFQALSKFDPAINDYVEVVRAISDTQWRDVKNNITSNLSYHPGTGRLTKVTTSSGQKYEVAFKEATYGTNNEHTRYDVTSTGSDCSSCPEHNYEYDERGNLSLITLNDGTVVRGYEYTAHPLDAERTYVSKVWQKEAGGSEEVVSETKYNTTPAKAITRYLYMDNSTSQVVVEKYIGNFDDVTQRDWYADVNPDLATDTPQSSRVSYEYDYYTSGAGNTNTTYYRTAVHSTKPDGGYVHTYLGSHGSPSFGRTTVRTVDDGSRTITSSEMQYVALNSDARQVTQVSTSEDIRGGLRQYTYDTASGLLETSIEPTVGHLPFSGSTGGSFQQTHYYDYDSAGHRTKSRWKTGNGSASTAFYAYDSMGQMTLQVDGYGVQNLSHRYVYDTGGRVVTSIDAGNVTKVSKYTTAGTFDREYTLDGAGPNALALMAYDYHEGRLTAIKRASENGPISSPATYSGTWVTDKYFYDKLGRRTLVVRAHGDANLSTRYAYDHQGRVIKVTKPDGTYTETVRDGRGRTVTSINAYVGAAAGDGLTTLYGYDANSNLTRTESPLGQVATYEYDGFDLRTKVIRGQ